MPRKYTAAEVSAILRALADRERGAAERCPEGAIGREAASELMQSARGLDAYAANWGRCVPAELRP